MVRSDKKPHCASLSALAIAILLAGALVPPAAEAGLPSIRHSLEQQPGLLRDDSEAGRLAMAELESLATMGVAGAQAMLAAEYSRRNSWQDMRTAAEYYRKAFNAGQTLVIGDFARMVNKRPALAAAEKPWFAGALGSYRWHESFASVRTTLDVYAAIPDIIGNRQAAELYRLYEMACLEDCNSAYFRAVIADRRGLASLAANEYALAATQSLRGMNAYFDFLGRDEQRKENFEAFAAGLEAEADSLPSSVVAGIAARLQTLNEEFNPVVVAWLDRAIAMGVEESVIDRIEYMLALPDAFSYDDTAALIEGVRRTHPVRADLLKASMMTTLAWSRLDPEGARDLLEALKSAGAEEAWIGMGELYTMGGLDEVDQFAAIREYDFAAARGNGAAFQKIAQIYRQGRSICIDRARAYVYGEFAQTLGEHKASVFLAELKPRLSVEDNSRLDELREELQQRYPSEKFR